MSVIAPQQPVQRARSGEKPMGTAEVAAEVEWLVSFGMNAYEIAGVLNKSFDSLIAAPRRNDRINLVSPFEIARDLDKRDKNVDRG